METIKIQKTKIHPMQEIESPLVKNMNFRHNGERWQFNDGGSSDWDYVGPFNGVIQWLNALFEVAKPLRTKEFEGYVYREDGKGRSVDDTDWVESGMYRDWQIIAHYEGWGK